MIWALAAEAVAVVALDQVPDTGVRHERQVAPAAVLGSPGPLADLNELVGRGPVRGQGQESLLRDTQPPLTQVVGSPLDQGDPELLRDHRLKERDVLADELFLEADRVGGDDDAAVLVFEW